VVYVFCKVIIVVSGGKEFTYGKKQHEGNNNDDENFQKHYRSYIDCRIFFSYYYIQYNLYIIVHVTQFASSDIKLFDCSGSGGKSLRNRSVGKRGAIISSSILRLLPDITTSE